MDSADRFIVNTHAYTQTWTAEQCLVHLAGMGFQHFELSVAPNFLWPGDMDQAGMAHFRRFLAGHRLRVVSLNMANTDLKITGASAETRGYSLALIERFITLGGEIGAAGIVIGIGKTDPLLQAPRDHLEEHLFRGLGRLSKAAEQQGVALWLENTPFSWEPTAEGLMDLLSRHGDDQIGAVFDVANAWFAGEDIGAGLHSMRSRLKLVHLSDTSKDAYRHDRIGRGTVPFAGLASLLAEVGYGGRPVLEVIEAEPDAALRESVARLRLLGLGMAHAPEDILAR